MMMRRLLLVVSVLSLLGALAVCAIWQTSYHHTLHYSFGAGQPTRWDFTSQGGNIMVTKSQEVGGMVMSRSVPYPDKRLLIAFLLVPLVGVLIEVRRRLPRPGGSR